jgi:hypothetical protein
VDPVVLAAVPHAGHGVLPMETILTFLQAPATIIG